MFFTISLPEVMTGRPLSGMIVTGTGGPLNSAVPDLRKVIPRPSIGLIKEVVSSAFRCDRGDLVCRNRRNNDARKVGIYLARELSGKSLQEIGAAFGGIKEAMVCHTAAEITKRMAEDKRFSKRIEELIETGHEN